MPTFILLFFYFFRWRPRSFRGLTSSHLALMCAILSWDVR